MSEENPYSAPATEAQVTPPISGPPGPHNYASLGERFLGKLIDTLVMIPVGIVLGIIWARVFTMKISAEPSIMDALTGKVGYGLFATVIMSIVGIIAYIAIQWTFWKGTGQSIGKKVMKTQIVNMDGSQADVKTIAFQRYLPIAALGSISFFMVGFLITLADALAIFRADRNCLHDDIAKTRVIKLPAPTH